MKPRFLKLLAFGTILAFSWLPGLDAATVVTLQSGGMLNQQQGYLGNKAMRFMFLDGQSQTPTQEGMTPTRPMTRLVLDFNGKTIVIQNSGDSEVYVKGQEPSGAIVNLEARDYALIKQNLQDLAQSTQYRQASENQADELHQALFTALSLLAGWPSNMPLLLWQDGRQSISSADRRTVVAMPDRHLAGNRDLHGKILPAAILQKPDSFLKLPEIEPFTVVPLPENAPASSAADLPMAAAVATNSSQSLCTKMGTVVAGSYPVLSVTFLPPFTKVIGQESYRIPVGGVQCLARCGAGCADSVSGVTGLGKNAYSQDCLDHDMCVAKRGSAALSCNAIFADAVNDFFSAPCGHDLNLLNTVVSNSATAASQAANVSANGYLYTVFTVKNNANTRLPHNKIYFDIYIDGVKRTTVQLPRILNAYDAARYYFQIGLPKAYRPGRHNLKIQVNAKALVQTVTSNDIVNRAFNLI